jgi:peptide/nickel transport system permease protein
MYFQLLRNRIFYIFPILLVIHILIFILFFVVNSPDDIARTHLGQKYISKTAIMNWKISYGFDKPLFYNPEEQGLKKLSETLFFHQTLELFTGNLGRSFNGLNINEEIKTRVAPSLAVALPALILTTMVNILAAMMLVYFRNTHLNQLGLILTICLLSISSLFYIIFSQYFLAFSWKWFPISGYLPGLNAIYFVSLPILVHIISGLGNGTRWCRTLLLEEIEQGYVNTARANGLSEKVILIWYVLRNTLLALSTAIIVEIPLLFLGSVLYESFFSIPGLGNYLIHALQQQDFFVVRAMVLLGSFAYMLGLILTDIFYLFIDPRVRLT